MAKTSENLRAESRRGSCVEKLYLLSLNSKTTAVWSLRVSQNKSCDRRSRSGRVQRGQNHRNYFNWEIIHYCLCLFWAFLMAAWILINSRKLVMWACGKWRVETSAKTLQVPTLSNKLPQQIAMVSSCRGAWQETVKGLLIRFCTVEWSKVFGLVRLPLVREFCLESR